MKRSEEWRRRAEQLNEFTDAARELQDFYASGRGDTGLEDKLRGRVAQAAGAAGTVAASLGFVGHVAGTKVNPIFAWERFIPGKVLTNPNQPIKFAETARGKCLAEAEAAEFDESGLTGFVARLVRFPLEVRERADITSKHGRAAAFWTAVAVETIAGLILAGLLPLTAWIIAKALT